MKSRRFGRMLGRFVAIALLVCWLTITAGTFRSPVTAQTEQTSDQGETLDRTKAFPYPTQLIPGQQKCIVLAFHEDTKDENRELTLQEVYAKENWKFPERWIWRQVCAGQEVNFYKFILSALFSGIKQELVLQQM
jgi:hypothetical protein